MKKIYRIFSKKIAIIFFSQLTKLFSKLEYKIIPSVNEIEENQFEYSKITRRFIYKSPANKFPKIIIDTSHFQSELCKIGASLGTNKSALNLKGHRSGYTPFYEILFRDYKDKAINFAEIGIEKNSSINMWRKFFSKAKIYGLEYDLNKIAFAKKQKLNNTIYKFIDVSDQSSIENTFKKINKKFDIIIDDSTHWFNDQINIIKMTNKYLKENGLLIIEDIYKFRKDHHEKNYFKKLSILKKKFKKIYFVEFHNINNYTASWKCEKILVLEKY